MGKKGVKFTIDVSQATKAIDQLVSKLDELQGQIDNQNTQNVYDNNYADDTSQLDDIYESFQNINQQIIEFKNNSSYFREGLSNNLSEVFSYSKFKATQDSIQDIILGVKNYKKELNNGLYDTDDYKQFNNFDNRIEDLNNIENSMILLQNNLFRQNESFRQNFQIQNLFDSIPNDFKYILKKTSESDGDYTKSLSIIDDTIKKIEDKKEELSNFGSEIFDENAQNSINNSVLILNNLKDVLKNGFDKSKLQIIQKYILTMFDTNTGYGDQSQKYTNKYFDNVVDQLASPLKNQLYEVRSRIYSMAREIRNTLSSDGQGYDNIETIGKIKSDLIEQINLYEQLAERAGITKNVVNKNLKNAKEQLTALDDAKSALQFSDQNNLSINTQELKSAFDQIDTSITHISQSANDLVDLIQRITGLSTSSEITAQWEKLQSIFTSLADENGKLVFKNADKQDIQTLMDEYKTYLKMGGKNSFADLTDDKKTKKTLLGRETKIKDQLSSEDVTDEANKFEQVEQTARSAAKAKEEFAEASKQAESSAEGTALSIQDENNKFEDTQASAQAAAQSKKVFAEANKQVESSAESSSSAIEEEKNELIAVGDQADNASNNLPASGGTSNPPNNPNGNSPTNNNNNNNNRPPIIPVNGERTTNTRTFDSLGNMHDTTRIQMPADDNGNPGAIYTFIDGQLVSASGQILDLPSAYKNANNARKQLTKAKIDEINFDTANNQSINHQELVNRKTDLQNRIAELENLVEFFEDYIRNMQGVNPDNDDIDNPTIITSRAYAYKLAKDADAEKIAKAQNKADSKISGTYSQVLNTLNDTTLKNSIETFLNNEFSGANEINFDINKNTSKGIVEFTADIVNAGNQVESFKFKYNAATETISSEKIDTKNINAFVDSYTAAIKEINNIQSDAGISGILGDSEDPNNKIQQKINEFKTAYAEIPLNPNDTDYTQNANAYIVSLNNVLEVIERVKKAQQDLREGNAYSLSLSKGTLTPGQSVDDSALKSNVSLYLDQLYGKRETDQNGQIKILSANTKISSITQGANGISTIIGTYKDANNVIQEFTLTYDNMTQILSKPVSAKANGFMSQLKSEFKNLGSTVSHLAERYLSFQDLIRYAQNAWSNIVSLDDALVDLRKTTTMTSVETNNFFENASEVAKQYGVTTSEIIQQASDWSRLGYSDYDSVTQMATLSSQFAAISPEMDTDTAQEGLVSIMKAYDIDVDNVLDGIMSKVNIVGNSFALTNQDIIEALERSGSTLSVLGQDLDSSIALITGAQEILQNSETVGTAIKTMSLRIRGFDEDTEELSDDLKNTTGKILDLTKTASAPEGISIFTDETKTHYKDLVDYFGEISEIWDEMSELDQNTYLDTLFGKRSVAAGAAIIQNYDAVKDSLAAMSDSEGNADEEMEIITDSISYKVNALKETWNSLFADSGNNFAIKNFIDELTKISEVITTIISKLGLFNTVFGAIIGGNFIKKFKSTYQQLSERFSKVNENVKMPVGQGIKGTLSNMKASLITLGIEAAVGIGASIYNYYKQRQEEIKQAAESATQDYNNTLDDVEDYKEQYASLREQYDNAETAEEQINIKDQILDLQKQISEQYGVQLDGIEDVNGELEKQLGLFEQISREEARKNLGDPDTLEGYKKSEKAMTKDRDETILKYSNPASETNKYSSVASKLDNILNGYKYISSDYSTEVSNIPFTGGAVSTQEIMELSISGGNVTETLEELNNLYDQLKALDGLSDEEQAVVDNLINDVRIKIAEYQGIVDENEDNYNAYLIQKSYDVVVKNNKENVKDDEGNILTYYDLYEQLTDAVDAYNEAVSSGDLDQIDEAESKLNALYDQIQGYLENGGEDVAGLNNIFSALMEGIDGSSKKLVELKKIANGDINGIFDEYKYKDLIGERINRHGYTLMNENSAEKYSADVIYQYADMLKDADLGALSGIDDEDGLIQILSPYVTGGDEVLSAPLLQTQFMIESDSSVDGRNPLVSQLSKWMDSSEDGSDLLSYLTKVGTDYENGTTGDLVNAVQDWLTTRGYYENKAYSVLSGIADKEGVNVEELIYELNNYNEIYKQYVNEINQLKTGNNGEAITSEDVWVAMRDESGETYEALKKLGEYLEYDFANMDSSQIEAFINDLQTVGIIAKTELEEIQEAYETLMSAHKTAYENVERLNTAFSESLSTTGLSVEWDDEADTVTGSYADLVKYYGLENEDDYDFDQAFSSTASGLKLNLKYWRAIRQEKEAQEKLAYEEEEANLLEQLAEQQEKLVQAEAEGTDTTKISQNISLLKTQVNQVKALAAAYTQATSRYQKLLDAQSNSDLGSQYDATADLLETGDNLVNMGLIGSDVLRNITSYFSYEDMSLATPEEIYAKYMEVRKKIKRYTSEDDTDPTKSQQALQNFLDDAVQLSLSNGEDWVITDGNGNYKFNMSNEDEDNFAKGMGLDIEFIQAIAEKLNQYGFDIHIGDSEDQESYNSKIEELTERANQAQQALKTAKEEANQLNNSDANVDVTVTENGEEGSLQQTPSGLTTDYLATVDVSSLNTIGDVRQAIDNITEIQSEINLDTTEAEAANSLLSLLQEKLNQLNNPVSVSTGIDYDTVTSAYETTGQLMKRLQGINGYNATAEVNAQIDPIQDQEVNNLAMTLAAMPTDILVSMGFQVEISEDGTQSITTESIINQLTNNDGSIKVPVEYYSVTGTDSSDSNAMADTSVDVNVNVVGAEQLQTLKEQIYSLANKMIMIKAVTKGQNDLDNMLSVLANLVDKVVNVTAKTFGQVRLNNLINSIKSLANATTTVNVSTTTTFKSGTSDATSGSTPTGEDLDEWNALHNFAKGSDGVKDDGKALVGELGTELLVRDGHFQTIGENGAEFTNVKRGDIIFNHKQTEQLLKDGHTNSRGKAVGGLSFVEGNAYAENSTWNRFIPVNTISGSSSSSSDSSSSDSSSSDSSSSDAAEATENTLDEIEILLNEIQRKIDNINSTVEDSFKTFSKRHSELSKEISAVNQKIQAETQAYYIYWQKANSVGLDESWASKIRTGALAIEDITDEDLYDKIQEYQKWWEKVEDCSDSIIDLRKNLEELYQTDFELIQTRFEGIIDEINFMVDQIQNYSDISTTTGYVDSAKYYEAMIDQKEKEINNLSQEYASLYQKFQQEISLGILEKGSEEYESQLATIHEIVLSIQEAQKALAEYRNTARELGWNELEKIQTSVSNITGEAEFLIGLLNKNSLFDEDTGEATDAVMATLGLYSQEYNNAMSQADKYKEALLKVNKELANDPNNTTLLDKQAEFRQSWQESIASAEDYKDSIKSLVEEGINAELSALKDLIDKYNDILSTKKEEYEYSKKMEEQQKTINDLYKQYAAYSSDNSEEGLLKRQQLQQQLKEANQELQETQWDQYISDTGDLLEELYSDYEETLNARLDDIDSLIQDVIDAVNGDGGIYNTIKEYADSVGYDLSDEMENTWNNGDTDLTNIVAMYGIDFNKQLTTLNNAVSNIVKFVEGLYNQADSEAATTLKKIGAGSYASGTKSVPKAGLYWTNENGAETIIRKSDGAILTKLNTGDSVLNNAAHSNLWSFANNPFGFINGLIQTPTAVGKSNISTETNNNISLSINLPNVKDYDSFVKELRNDSNFERLVQEMTVGKMYGNNSLRKFAI